MSHRAKLCKFSFNHRRNLRNKQFFSDLQKLQGVWKQKSGLIGEFFKIFKDKYKKCFGKCDSANSAVYRGVRMRTLTLFPADFYKKNSTNKMQETLWILKKNLKSLFEDFKPHRNPKFYRPENLLEQFKVKKKKYCMRKWKIKARFRDWH